MWEFNNKNPIYLQLFEQIKVKIINGEYNLGERLPSVRDFAIETKTNPNTVQKALTELENIGLINTQRTNGKFVIEDLSKINEVKTQYLMEKITIFLSEMESLKVSKAEIVSLINKGDK